MALFKDLKKEDVKETKTETISYVIFGQDWCSRKYYQLLKEKYGADSVLLIDDKELQLSNDFRIHFISALSSSII